MIRPEISIVTSVYHDACLIPRFLDEVEQAMEALLGACWQEKIEVIFVHDGGGREEWKLIEAAVKAVSYARALDLSRNYGQHIALICGYKHTSGKLVVRLNLDCQDPPSEIPKLHRKLLDNDHDMVVGLQEKRESSLSDRITGYIFFKVFNFLTNSKVPADTSSLRIMRRSFVEAVCSMGDREPFLQGLESLCGFSVGYDVIKHRARTSGRSSYTLFRRCCLAIDASVSYSDRPLRLAVGFGAVTCALGVVGVLVQIVLFFLKVEFLSGYLSIVALLVVFFGIQTTLTAIVGIYVGKTLLHAQNRPLFFLKSDTSESYET